MSVGYGTICAPESRLLEISQRLRGFLLHVGSAELLYQREVGERGSGRCPGGQPVRPQEVMDHARDVELDNLKAVVFPAVGDASTEPIDDISAAEFVQPGKEHATPLVGGAIDIKGEQVEPALVGEDGCFLLKASSGDGIEAWRCAAVRVE